jgi:lysophospholipase L1-like esterase
MEQQTEALKEVCRKYSIPFVDLMNESGGFNCNLDYIVAKYTTNSDGCHPNEAGYKRFYVPQIIKMFEKLITID